MLTDRPAPRTVWIGGSYEAACSHIPRKRGPKKPAGTIRERMLQQVLTFPGSPTALLIPEGVNAKTARNALMQLSIQGLAHSIRRYESAGRLRGTTSVNYWYPGPAPKENEG